MLRFSIGHSIFYGLDHLSKLAKFTISCRIGYIITKNIIWKLDNRKIDTVFYCVFRTFRIFGGSKYSSSSVIHHVSDCRLDICKIYLHDVSK